MNSILDEYLKSPADEIGNAEKKSKVTFPPVLPFLEVLTRPRDEEQVDPNSSIIITFLFSKLYHLNEIIYQSIVGTCLLKTNNHRSITTKSRE